MNESAVLVVTVALLSVYTMGIGGSTAIAIGVRDAWRKRPRVAFDLDPGRGEIVLAAPTLPRLARILRVVGWIAFPVALVLGVFANAAYPWLVPVTVFLMVALNAFYFTAMHGLGEPLLLSSDSFRIGPPGRARPVRWVHVTDFMGAHIGPFRGARMSEEDEWQDPKTVPNVIFYRLNRALVRPRKSILDRVGGLSYYDGVIRNVFGLSTQQLMTAMRAYHRRALEAEGPPLNRPQPGRPFKNPGV